MTSLIGLDWGTSSLRAYRMDVAGTVLEQRRENWGILQLPEGGFAEAYRRITDGWVAGTPACLASGMVGSRNGWREAPYAGLPFDLTTFDVTLTEVDVPGSPPLRILPGLADATRPDVLRGEETEAAGAFELLGRPAGRLAVVLPGTHSKWLLIEDGLVRRFATALTGELFSILLTHSILARPVGDPGASGPEAARDAFADGVARGAAGGALLHLFSARAAGLLGQRAAELTAPYVSGILLGEEIARMRADGMPAPVALVGDAAVTARYAEALALLDLPPPERMGTAAATGLFMAAGAHNLLPAPGDASC